MLSTPRHESDKDGQLRPGEAKVEERLQVRAALAVGRLNDDWHSLLHGAAQRRLLRADTVRRRALENKNNALDAENLKRKNSADLSTTASSSTPSKSKRRVLSLQASLAVYDVVPQDEKEWTEYYMNSRV